jgi:hypothetical protein
MNQNPPLPNFSDADAVLEAAQKFYARLAEACRNAAPSDSPRDQQFLRHAATALDEVASALARQRESGDESVLRTRLQYTPDEHLPGDEDLRELEASGASTDGALDHLLRMGQVWTELFERLAESSSTPETADLYQGCRELLEAHHQHIAAAHAQLRDV